MTFLRNLRRTSLRVLAPLATAVALLAACGGGSSQVQSFVPARLLVIGDETGVMVDVDGNKDGYKYGLNDRVTAITATTAHCQLLPTPAQTIAAHYGLVFSACNPTGVEPKAFSHAMVGAQADDATTGLKAQLDAISGLGSNDMVLVSIGTNDIIAVYEQRRDGGLASDALAIAEARRRGTAAASQVSRLLATGARALVFTTPVLGKSPYAIKADDANPGAAKLITDLTSAFNAGLRVFIQPQDGRQFGLILSDDVTGAIARYPTSYLASPANASEALPGKCTTSTLPQDCVVDPDNGVKWNTHLWATDRLVGPVALAQIGNQALSRTINNPF